MSDEQVSLVVQTAFLGDAVLTTPLIAELSRRGPVDVVVRPSAAPLLANNPAVRDIIVYDKRGTDRGLPGLWRTSRRLVWRTTGDGAPRARRAVDVAYLAQGSWRSAALTMLAGIRNRVGFASSPARRLYTRAVPFRDELHHAERLWRLASTRSAGEDAPPPPAETIRPRLYPGTREISAVDAILAEHGWDGEPLLVLAPGSVWGTKRWPYYAQLARLVGDRWRIAIVGGPNEVAEAGAIVDALDGRHPIDTAGTLSLLGAAELLRHAAAVVTNDSASLHVASAMRTPTVAVFGPTVPEFGFGPLARPSAVAGHPDLACRPCSRHGPQECPLTHWRCMRDVAPETVAALLESVVSTPTP